LSAYWAKIEPRRDFADFFTVILIHPYSLGI